MYILSDYNSKVYEVLKEYYIEEQNKTVISGIEFEYMNRENGQLITPGTYKNRNEGRAEYSETFQLKPLEYLVDFHLWVDDENIRKIQFIKMLII